VLATPTSAKMGKGRACPTAIADKDGRRHQRSVLSFKQRQAEKQIPIAKSTVFSEPVCFQKGVSA